MQELSIPGAAVALIENARIATLRVYGVADKETGAAVTPDTLFSLQSISKSIAACGVMRLVERGQVDLEAPIWDYVRGWRLPPSRFDEREVTLRRLLCHYAGISTAGFPGIDPEGEMPSLIDGLNGLLHRPYPFQGHGLYPFLEEVQGLRSDFGHSDWQTERRGQSPLRRWPNAPPPRAIPR